MSTDNFAGVSHWQVHEADFGEQVELLNGKVMLAPADNMICLQVSLHDPKTADPVASLGIWLNPEKAAELSGVLHAAATRGSINTRFPGLFGKLFRKGTGA